MWAFLNRLAGKLPQRLQHRRGETLLEILIALMVLGTTSGAATFLIIQSNRTSVDIQRQFQARYLAREAFEHLKMVRDTNWIRFADKECWDTALSEKSCSVKFSNKIAAGTPRDFALLSGEISSSLDFRLQEVTDENALTSCENFDVASISPYAIYQSQAEDDTLGMMYGPDPAAPAGQTPLFCRKITLVKQHDDAIKADVTILWRRSGVDASGAQNLGVRQYTSYLINY